MNELNLSDIIQHNFDSSQYYREVFDKRQIVLHHTSGGNINGTLNWWLNDNKHIGTAIIIDRDGSIHQVFSTKYWSHHLGIRNSDNTKLNKQSIGIEICNWGGLTKENGKYYNYVGGLISEDRVVKHSYRGYEYFEKYTEEQIESLEKLLIYLCKKYDIPCNFNNYMFDVSEEALNGIKGIWSHSSYRSDKSDIYPDLDLIDMLDNLVNR